MAYPTDRTGSATRGPSVSSTSGFHRAASFLSFAFLTLPLWCGRMWPAGNASLRSRTRRLSRGGASIELEEGGVAPRLGSGLAPFLFAIGS